MNKHTLTSENYFSPENELFYMGSSQFKNFQKCEAAALAELRGEYKRETTDALLVGSYVDAHFEGTLDIFKAQHPEIFKKDGELKVQYKQAEKMIQRAERSELFMQFMSGEKQLIMTGEIAGVPFKIKIDSYVPGKCINDLKTIKDFQLIWNPEKKQRQHFINYWGYDLQGAIYREIVRQNTGKTLPFFISAITKEAEPDLDVLWVPDDDLDSALEVVTSLAPRFQKLKNGELQPQRCGHCDYCRFTKVLTAPRNYHEDCEVYEVEC